MALGLVGLGFIVVFFAGHFIGWNEATRDTERRWSEAVRRADDDRAEQERRRSAAR